jgi:glycosyltransferase involved in cell wall biosynthesis
VDATRERLTVLLTNFDLRTRGGTQLYLRDVALALLRRGHRPFAYSTSLGEVADDLRAATVPVVDDLDRIDERPDIIHGHHNHELMTALLRFPGTPAIRVCHGWLDERPCVFPRILRYVAVDETTRDRCLLEWGLPGERVHLLLNFADLSTFVRRAALPARPARALAFGNNARAYTAEVRTACARHGITLDEVGKSAGNATARPERVLGQYDLVFAKGRAAIEAMATGAAVVLCDASGLGPMVTQGEFDRLRPLNFGLRALRNPVEADAISAEIARYDAHDAAVVCDRLRADAGAEPAFDAIVDLYYDTIDEFARSQPASATAEMRAASAYLRSIGPRLQWAASPRAALSVLARPWYLRALRVPGLGRLVQSRARRELQAAAARRGF